MDFKPIEIVKKSDDSILYYGFVPEIQHQVQTISTGLEFNPNPPPNDSILQILPPRQPPSKTAKLNVKTISFQEHTFSPVPVYKGVQFTTLGGHSFKKYPEVLDDSGADAGFVLRFSELKALLSATRDLYCTLSNGDIMAIGTLQLDEPHLVVETTVLGRNWDETEPVVGRFLVSDVLKRAHNGHLSKPSYYVNYPEEIGSQILAPIPTREDITMSFKSSPQAVKLMGAAMEENNTGEALFKQQKYNESILSFQRASVFGYFSCPTNLYGKILYNLAYCYYALGMFSPAEKWIGVSLQSERTNMREKLYEAIRKAKQD